MDMKEVNLLQLKRDPDDIMVIKEEDLSDDCDLLKYRYIVNYLNNNSTNEGLKTEPGAFAVCEGNALTSLEETQFSSDFLTNDIQEDNQSCAQGLKVRVTRSKKRKPETERETINNAQKSNCYTTKSGKLKRDEIFKDREYFCTLCQTRYIGRKCFRMHFKHHFTVCKNQYQCLICNYTTRIMSHINRHLLVTHFLKEEEKLFVCYLCQKRFNDKKDLERHMFTHTGEGTLRCSECSYSSMLKYRLQNHISTVHGKCQKFKNSENSQFICHHCEFICTSKSSLRAHIKRHLGIKCYQCSECGYSCTGGGDLQKHWAIHSNERPYVCNTCKKTFKRRSHLLIHFNAKYGCRGNRRKKDNSKKV